MTSVRVSSGIVRGSLENQVYSFKGVPYAEPIAGRARWLPPQPRREWTGERDATRYGPVSQQFASRAMLGPFPTARRRYLEAIGAFLPHTVGDDCLLLNLWSPTLDRNAKRPVMVFIHGGSLTSGAANQLYDGTDFAAKGVVCVAIQYRLGPTGFLHGAGLFDGDFCGNNRGFLDQVAALRWVQQNIAIFGGDPDCVTIFGESAGAFSVYQLTASPLAKGLFRRAIAMGGNPLTCAVAADYQALARDALADVGVKPGDEAALIALDAPQLLKLQSAVTSRIFGKAAPGIYGSLSGEKVAYMGAVTGTDFLPHAPLAAYRNGTANDVDLLLGTCADDGQLFSLMLPLSMTLSAKWWGKHLSAIMPGGDWMAARDFYKQQMPDAGTLRVCEQLNNDAFFRMPTIAAAEAHAAQQPGRTYLYQVDYCSAIRGLNAVHAIDVALLFGERSAARGLSARDEQTRRLSTMMLDAWTRFAATGKPVAPGMPAWAPYETSRRATLVFDRNSRSEADYGGELRRYWAIR
jgi:para-nitrobenzyl esterase